MLLVHSLILHCKTRAGTFAYSRGCDGQRLKCYGSRRPGRLSRTCESSEGLNTLRDFQNKKTHPALLRWNQGGVPKKKAQRAGLKVHPQRRLPLQFCLRGCNQTEAPSDQTSMKILLSRLLRQCMPRLPTMLASGLRPDTLLMAGGRRDGERPVVL